MNGGVPFERVQAKELESVGPENKEKLVGLALSGGGIRSATFNLGVLQALAKHGLLKRVDYLSTVSGGGYIGSWLSAWAARPNHNIAVVERKLAGEREPPEVSFLREYSNYLTPRLGWLSPDTLTMAATYLRNFLLNLAIIISWFAIFMLVPWALGRAAAIPSPGFLLIAGMILLTFSVVWISANVVWQEVEENTPEAHAMQRPKGPFFTQPMWINILVVLPLVLWGYAVSTALHRAPALLEPAIWAVMAVAGVALLIVIREVMRWWMLRRHDVSGRFNPWRRGGAFMLGTLTGVGLLVVFVKEIREVERWHVLVWGVPVMVSIFLLSATVILGISGRSESEYAREWWSRLGGLMFRIIALWLALSGAAIYGPLVVSTLEGYAKAQVSLAWLVTTLASVMIGKSAATGEDGSRRWLDVIAKLGPYVFIIGLFIAVSSLLYNYLAEDPWTFLTPEEYFEELDAVKWRAAGAVLSALFLAAMLLSATVDVNLFSFHMFYRNRLVRCYLGASRPFHRRALPFIGFDPRDNPAMKDLEPRPYHIVNTALNLTSAERLGWQERKAASFVLTRDYCGYHFPKVGPSGDPVVNCFQPTADYAAEYKGRMNLGTAMAISGAAASPNMGYHSSPSVAFLLTVFNVRLGWWMQNTSSAESWRTGGPHFGLRYLICELFGISTDRSKFVQLTDGGHFDNLGIYELVRRRCRFIIVTDAGEDPLYKFEDLGNAIRKSFIDHEVDIRITKRAIVPDPGNRCSLYHCAVGTIHYDRTTPPGYLLYIKPTLTGNEPPDVSQYAAAHPLFPHESTGDQFFSESQFESYRKLGFHIADAVFEDAARKASNRNVLDLETLFVALKERWCPPARVGAGEFARHGDQFAELQDTLRTDPRLAFLNTQVYPEWETLMRGKEDAPTEIMEAQSEGRSGLWLPDGYDETRAGFHFCNSMLQLMENVYVDLNLQQEHEHPDNRGWMNLFRHWSWSGMFKVTYAVCCSMYGARFQTFCERNLNLRPGEVRVDRSDDYRDVSQLNFVERRIVEELRRAEVAYDSLWLLQTMVRSPEDLDRNAPSKDRFVYTFGFCLTLDDEIVYFRVQDHVRKIGHARRALIAQMLGRETPWKNATGNASKAHLDWLEPHDISGFARLFQSVQQQQRTETRRS
jgi:hypothetical protein